MKKIILITVILLASCSSNNVKVHGNMIRDDDLSYVEAGETSKNDMIMMFGQPTNKSTFDKETWYYVGQTVKYQSFMKPDIVERKVVEVCFDENGLVDSVKNYDLADGQDIEPCPEETKSIATEKTAIQEMIGNIGKFNTIPQRVYEQ